MGRRFPKAYRLLRRKEFTSLYETGTPWRNAGFHLFVGKRSGGGPCRMGVTVTRRVGNAVVRNRLKRWTRENFRLRHEVLRSGYDFVVNHHPRLATVSREEFDRLFKNVLEKAHLYGK